MKGQRKLSGPVIKTDSRLNELAKESLFPKKLESANRTLEGVGLHEVDIPPFQSMTGEVAINKKNCGLWTEHFSEITDARSPLLFPALSKNCLLFVGCNPSFSPKGFRKMFRGTPEESLDVNDFYLWRNTHENFIENSIRFEIIAKSKHDYFRKFDQIAKETGLDWEHIDLFFVRETNQKVLEKQIMSGKKLNAFGRQQLEIAKELLIITDPKVIIVANAFASGIFQRSIPCLFDDVLGCHRIPINTRSVPVFFSSMFTGQRALDNGSFRRLKWHIDKVVKELYQA